MLRLCIKLKLAKGSEVHGRRQWQLELQCLWSAIGILVLRFFREKDPLKVSTWYLCSTRGRGGVLPLPCTVHCSCMRRSKQKIFKCLNIGDVIGLAYFVRFWSADWSSGHWVSCARWLHWQLCVSGCICVWETGGNMIHKGAVRGLLVQLIFPSMHMHTLYCKYAPDCWTEAGVSSKRASFSSSSSSPANSASRSSYLWSKALFACMSECCRCAKYPETVKSTEERRQVETRGEAEDAIELAEQSWDVAALFGEAKHNYQLPARAAPNTSRQLNVYYLVQTVRSSIRATHEVVDFVHVLEHV